MAEDWASQQAERMAGPARSHAGVWLFLGGTDAGKMTLVAALARRLAGEHEVAVLDADIGQSHIGPPTTIGWALAQRVRRIWPFSGRRGSHSSATSHPWAVFSN
jgi:polynucleotide 5'-kinase involved in rRNA processing